MFWLCFILYLASGATVQKDYLYIWGGGTSGDGFATVDFTADSLTYGQVLHWAPLVASDRVQPRGNEAHHSGISNNGKYLVGGGLLSFFGGKDEVFVYEIDPVTRFPSFSYSLDLPAACTDEFVPIGDEEFLVTMMCNEVGKAPGTVARFNARTREVSDWLVKPAGWFDEPPSAEAAGFNPHGCGWHPEHGLLVTDYVQPVSLFSSPPKVEFRDTVRHIDNQGNLKSTILQPGIHNDGMMDIRWIPNDPLRRGITSGTSGNGVYLVYPFGDPENADPALRNSAWSKKVFDLATIVNGVTGLSSGYGPVSPDGKRISMTFSMRYVTLCDISDPENPFDLDIFDFCDPPVGSGAPDFSAECDATNNSVGTHYAFFFGDRLVVFNYFLILGNFNFAGTGTVHAFRLEDNWSKLVYDRHFNLDLSDLMDHPHSARPLSFTVEESGPLSSGSSLSALVSLFFLALTYYLM